MMWFALGAAISVFGAFLGTVVLGPGLGLVLGFMIGTCSGGALAGRSLDRGSRGVAGFAIAFTIAFPAALPFLASARTSEPNELAGLILSFSGYGIALFGLLGLIGGSIVAMDWREGMRSAAIFASAGAFGGILLAVVIRGMGADSSLFLHAAAFVLVPATIGGSVFSSRLRRIEIRT